MKTLIAYYSRTGTNEAAAKGLHGIIGGDIERITDTADRESIFWSAMAAILKRKTKIGPIEKDPANYDLVVIATPMWAGSIPPATRTYLSENKGKIKEAALLSICGRGTENEKPIPQFVEIVGKKPSASLLVKAEEWKNADTKGMLEGFAREIKEE